jgi:nucleoside-diphosphate-sugar epimerase
VGYLLALEKSVQESDQIVDSYNFGPLEPSLHVKEVIDVCMEEWAPKFEVAYNEITINSELESSQLALNPTLAVNTLGWRPFWTQKEAIKGTIKWWRDVLDKRISPIHAAQQDINAILSNHT